MLKICSYTYSQTCRLEFHSKSLETGTSLTDFEVTMSPLQPTTGLGGSQYVTQIVPEVEGFCLTYITLTKQFGKGFYVMLSFSSL